MTTETDDIQEPRGMVLWRREETPGNKISVRLSPDVPRDADLYELFREGFLIEVINIEMSDDETKRVIFGIQGSKEFIIDRDEKLTRPRKELERALVPAVSVPLVAASVMNGWSVQEYTDYIDTLKIAGHKVQGYVRLMKRDLSLASERGWHLRANTRHQEWLVIKEEAALLIEQAKMIEARREHAMERRSALVKRLEAERLQRRNDHFVSVAKELLSPEEYKRLMEQAKAREPGEDMKKAS